MLQKTLFVDTHKIEFPIRLVSYFSFWVFYLHFMSQNAPLGVDWLTWHLYRIFNAVEYLKVNGYLSSFGFSIWSSCQDCGFAPNDWSEKIYISFNNFRLTPYIILNYIGGFELLNKYGPMLDKYAIFIGAVTAAELSIICFNKISIFPAYVVGIYSFIVFTSSPWVYRMLVASWFEVYFLMFILLGILLIIHKFNKIGLLMFFLAGYFHHQWAFFILIYYFLLYIGLKVFKDNLFRNNYFPLSNNKEILKGIISVLLISIILDAIIRLIAFKNLNITTGSSLIYRIGLTGNDIHNGSLLGAIQFLGGNRLTICLQDNFFMDILNKSNKNIFVFNCFLSISSMILLSFGSVFGLLVLLKKSKKARWIILPITYSLLSFITIFQQLLSAHLMGYSYIFSFLFSCGIMGLLNFCTESISSTYFKVIISIPFVIGVVVASIRVSMLTGLGG